MSNDLKDGLPIILIKTIGDNYTIYNLISILTTIILTSVRCTTSKCRK